MLMSFTKSIEYLNLQRKKGITMNTLYVNIDVNIKFTNKTHPITTPPYKVNSFSFKIKNLFKSLLS